MSDNDRLSDLEIRLAYLEAGIDTLDQVVARQADQIEILLRANRELYQRLKSLLATHQDSQPEEEEPPPHY